MWRPQSQQFSNHQARRAACQPVPWAAAVRDTNVARTFASPASMAAEGWSLGDLLARLATRSPGRSALPKLLHGSDLRVLNFPSMSVSSRARLIRHCVRHLNCIRATSATSWCAASTHLMPATRSIRLRRANRSDLA
jgi:hypothetical protein